LKTISTPFPPSVPKTYDCQWALRIPHSGVCSSLAHTVLGSLWAAACFACTFVRSMDRGPVLGNHLSFWAGRSLHNSELFDYMSQSPPWLCVIGNTMALGNTWCPLALVGEDREDE
jgi:hypothetical protein